MHRYFQGEDIGKKKEKPELDRLLLILREGDVLIVDSLDRLGRTSKELIHLLTLFKEKGIQFKSLKEGMFDTTTPMGEAIFQIIAILKAMEVEVLRERTVDGLKAARARGKKEAENRAVIIKTGLLQQALCIKMASLLTIYLK